MHWIGTLIMTIGNPPKDYQLCLFKKMQNLKKRLLTIKEYNVEFQKLNIRVGHVEDTSKRVARYINGLIFEIQYEISLLSPKSMEEAYQYALKENEKLSRKQAQNIRDRGINFSGRGKQSS